ncbi:MAG: 6-phosphofructokinase [Anaerolineae bacterium]|nr:6-phosphofructokinase [Anaerolineae bacterium]
MKAIAVLTSGGDAPGMNAAIRAITRVAIDRGTQVFGVKRGYQGLMTGDFIPLGLREVGGVMQYGGTFLGSARAPEFKTPEGRKTAIKYLEAFDINGVVVIGGNGSQTGASALNDMGMPTIGVASTIDNDLIGSEITIGVDTALNIALEAVDRLKVTASSHRRAFLVEVMGRDCGYLALMTGISGGAEAVIIPEIPTPPQEVVEELSASYKRGKTNGIVIVAEGAKHGVNELLAYCAEQPDIGFEIRAVTLGHVQRGGTPTAYDRLLGTRLGANAVERLIEGEHGGVVGMIKGEETFTPYSEVVGRTKGVDPKLFALADVLAK